MDPFLPSTGLLLQKYKCRGSVRASLYLTRLKTGRLLLANRIKSFLSLITDEYQKVFTVDDLSVRILV